ncbi:hypothetical protein TUMSATVNIG1_61110 (plasmid) [Vibrio nigripulchritudo]|uniref:hypothetical protein n=1 Tax=Vibrio nigripulchritudo TaxID=28173 RepID=UPI001C79635E|nr:hypothetical protein [Vibrio nigripulchritudo]BCL74127.1 hypothetical protein VNTUMSATTG_60640 [Vibrio nigripulchritudo]BDU35502.1 hypothetical protein TUMSATVNIG1_61110 [Vibrio nigripulchritudo]
MSDMDFTKHWTSERTRKKQTALTKLSNGLLKEVIGDPFSTELFEREEIDAIEIAAKALSNAKLKFAHIKEKKARIEKRKAQELAHIDKQCKENAIQTLNSLNCNNETFTREQLCLWVTVASLTRSVLTPESWELDINHNMDNHYFDSDHAYRKCHVRTMRDKAQSVFEDFLKSAWQFSFENDAWIVRVPIKQAVEELKGLMKHEEYARSERRYAHLLEPLEAYNREVEALRRRQKIKSV